VWHGLRGASASTLRAAQGEGGFFILLGKAFAETMLEVMAAGK
jgi:hypothetical protein